MRPIGADEIRVKGWVRIMNNVLVAYEFLKRKAQEAEAESLKNHTTGLTCAEWRGRATGYQVAVDKIEPAVNVERELIETIRELTTTVERLDRQLLTVTGSPYECEKGEVTRAKELLARI